jgi:hypothetical protein
VVDYTGRRKTERKNFLYVFTITCGPPQREELLRKILGGGGVFFKISLNKITQREERLREFDSFVYVFTITSSGAHHREKKIFFLNNNNNNNIYLGGIYNIYFFEVCHNEFSFLLRTFMKSLCSFELWTERNL